MQKKGVVKCLVVLNFRDRLIDALCDLYNNTMSDTLCPHCSGTFKGITGAFCFQTGPDEEYSCDCLSVSSFGRSGEIPEHFNFLKEYQKLHF